jgi:hypothetical protein
VSRELVFLPGATRDFLDTKSYYESLSPARGGNRFEIAFHQSLHQIKAGLITHAKAFTHFHRVNLPRFPYTLYYRLANNRAVIIAVLYARFDPKRIEARLRERLDE